MLIYFDWINFYTSLHIFFQFVLEKCSFSPRLIKLFIAFVGKTNLFSFARNKLSNEKLIWNVRRSRVLLCVNNAAAYKMPDCTMRRLIFNWLNQIELLLWKVYVLNEMKKQQSKGKKSYCKRHADENHAALCKWIYEMFIKLIHSSSHK